MGEGSYRSKRAPFAKGGLMATIAFRVHKEKGARLSLFNGAPNVWQTILVLIGVRDGIAALPGEGFPLGASRIV
jgi:hypothetical protein